MRPVLANMGIVLQLAGILVAFPIGMGFIYNENQAIPDQTGKPTKKPTMRRVFQVNDMHRKILALFGNRIESAKASIP